MRNHLINLTAFACLAIATTPAVKAQAPNATPAPIEISATPSQITIAGTRGAIETRRVLFTANGEVKGIKIIPLDLTRADDRAVLSATAITGEPPSTQIKANDPLIIPLTFNLNNSPSGEFKGEVRVQYDGGKLAIPVTVKIKDFWLPPLAALLLGIGLSIFITRYREQGKPRDELLVRAGQLRGEMRSDPELDRFFRARIEALLIDSAAALSSEKWEEAKRSIEQAETVMARWHKGRGDWRPQLDYRDGLIKQLENQFGQKDKLPAYLLAVRRGIEDAGRNAPDLAGPDKLRDELDRLARQINRYSRLNQQMQTLTSRLRQLPAPPGETLVKARRLQQDLNDLSPGDDQGAERLRGEIESLQTEIEKLLAQQPKPAPVAVPKGSFGIGDFGQELTLLNLISPAPSANPLEITTGEGAGARLKWFWRVSYATAVIILAGVGFGELYVLKPTFGANWWTDYFALLAWGFGAEATRAAVIDWMRGQGVVGLK